MLYLPACEQTRPKVNRRYARRRVQAIQHISGGFQEILLEVGRWVWRFEGSYPVVLEKVVELRPVSVGGALAQAGFENTPNLCEHLLVAGWKSFSEL